MIKTEIEKVVEIFDGQTRMARTLRVSDTAVSKWVAQGRVPTRRVLQIMQYVAGKETPDGSFVTLHSLLEEACCNETWAKDSNKTRK